MKIRYLLLALFLYSQSAHAETYIDTKLLCDDTASIVKTLKEKYKEKPIVIGKAGDEAESTMTLWVNSSSKTWTILATKNKITCIVGVGDEVKLINFLSNSGKKT